MGSPQTAISFHQHVEHRQQSLERDFSAAIVSYGLLVQKHSKMVEEHMRTLWNVRSFDDGQKRLRESRLRILEAATGLMRYEEHHFHAVDTE